MKPLNKEDMPKLIVLIVLAVGIFGFALFQFVASSSPSVAAVPAAPAKKAAAAIMIDFPVACMVVILPVSGKPAGSFSAFSFSASFPFAGSQREF